MWSNCHFQGQRLCVMKTDCLHAYMSTFLFEPFFKNAQSTDTRTHTHIASEIINVHQLNSFIYAISKFLNLCFNIIILQIIFLSWCMNTFPCNMAGCNVNDTECGKVITFQMKCFVCDTSNALWRRLSFYRNRCTPTNYVQAILRRNISGK